ncbi:CBS domain-containing protein [Halodesulfurarchaeum sp.]|uniref:CBS domain-containing protein n=1 Tax=Halodesulfurarchaeum sp. TaxID=1980530 RepID=UPI001BBE0F26|nr:CBS domain-containing protein [Halodesulfurarchaeum sp.]
MNPLVSDLMETDVVTIGANQTLTDVGTKLYETGVGSLIVHSDEAVPMGIITPQDLLQAVAESSRILSEIVVTEYMSRPLLTIEQDRPVRSAVRRMNEEGVEQLAIVDEYEVIGIVSQKDVLTAYESLIQAAHETERQPRTD